MNLFEGRLKRYISESELVIDDPTAAPVDKPCPRCRQLKESYGKLCHVCQSADNVLRQQMDDDNRWLRPPKDQP